MDLSIRRSINGVVDTIEIKNATEAFIDELIEKMCANPPYGIDMDPIHALRYERSIEKVRLAYEEAGITLSASVPRKRDVPSDEVASAWEGEEPDMPAKPLRNARDVRMARSPEPKVKYFKKNDGTLGDPNYSVAIDCDVCGHESFGWSRYAGGHVKCKHCKTQLLVEDRFKEPMRADAGGCVFKANRPIEYLEGSEMI